MDSTGTLGGLYIDFVDKIIDSTISLNLETYLINKVLYFVQSTGLDHMISLGDYIK